ncbi:conserved hypothetical protein [Beutenbergia cavernae DSM 12333]|uniref:ATP-grasp domain-containing protein n=1 Tax=Beutenbergia cavernae (strain ATCC BAA-8 / DSM 12333 / CCUG 43141 / JCM 11478 / NBRC 16432 / NCIMB 13614 / HKI 0122) TaxID=471853 RepID=C5BY99_BEUC1|nr:ATP-grasp domain-containing protein [Beutenbergia cavernae]ACQ80999.1 conserved hypothetical protein [Beutenbergia cavernae DSM 12333]
MTGLLVPADPLAPRAPDGHFAPEASAAREAGAAVVLLDHDALLAGEADAAVARVPSGAGPLWYRGWMIPADRYAELEDALRARGVGLGTTAPDYARAHELPGWYPTFAGLTPRSVWRASSAGEVPDADTLAALVAPLGGGAGIVKDYVKSRKHEWAEACFVPDLADATHLHRVVARFVQLQDSFLAGGIVVRAFERFAAPDGGRAAEARVWWVDGAPVVVGPHPDTPDDVPAPDLAAVAPAVAALGCRFVTTDLALRDDGVWRVVEVGDGQVSDRPTTLAPSSLLEPLLRAPAS